MVDALRLSTLPSNVPTQTEGTKGDSVWLPLLGSTTGVDSNAEENQGDDEHDDGSKCFHD